MKSKVESKKPVSSDSSTSDSSDDEPKVKAPSKAAAAAKTTTPKASQEKVTPVKVDKTAKAPKVKESAIPKSVPATKFPKRNTTSSSDSDSSSEDEPVAKKSKPQPANNKVAATNNHAVVTTPKHQPAVSAAVHQSPKRDPPAHVATPVKRAPGSQVPAPTPAVVPKSVPVTATGDEQYKRTETKKEVTNLFGSNCPHCGHDIEVRLKLS